MLHVKIYKNRTLGSFFFVNINLSKLLANFSKQREYLVLNNTEFASV